MKFLQVGLGSMGKRRIRCLKTLGEHDILAFDTRDDRRGEAEQMGVKVVKSFEEGLAAGVDAVLVSTPPDAHYPFVKAAAEHGKHSFCEANIVTEGALEFTRLAAERGVVAAPSASFRFHPIYQKLRRWVVEEQRIGKPLLMNFHMGNYILDWHPWEGLEFYGGRKATGAAREMVPFEFEWMQWIFGPVESVLCSYGKHLDLPTDMDDAYSVLARFESGLEAQVLLEVISRYPVRDGRLVSQAGTISWDFESLRLRHYDGDTQMISEEKASGKGFNIEEMYVAEIDAFLKACRGEEAWSHTYLHDHDLGRLVLACERSSDTGQRVHLRDIP